MGTRRGPCRGGCGPAHARRRPARQTGVFRAADTWEDDEMSSQEDTGAQTPLAEEEIAALRQEIDRLDAEILAAVKRRTEVSRIIGQTRMASGGPRLVHSREMKVLDRFSDLGREGHTLAMLLLRLGRGPLGR
ncbi:chorismate mutase [Tsukamurella soli]